MSYKALGNNIEFSFEVKMCAWKGEREEVDLREKILTMKKVTLDSNSLRDEVIKTKKGNYV